MRDILLRLRALAFVTAGSWVLSGAVPFSDSRVEPVFPVQFEQSGLDWVARGPGYRLVLDGGDAVLAASDGKGHTDTIGMRIVGRRKKAFALPEREAPGRRNYLVGADPTRWRTNVRLWEQVRFVGIMDGVDIVYHGGGRRFEYDLVIDAGGDASAITISLAGAGVKLNKSGDLIMHTGAGDVIQRKPVAYQTEHGQRREVSAAFRLDGRRLRFVLGAYDHSKPVIIDPVIDFATWFPGNISNVVADSDGSAYIAGQVWAPDLPVTSQAYQPTASGSISRGKQLHLFVARFSADGSTLVYCTYLSGSMDDTSASIAVDASGNLVVGGTTASADFPLTAGSYISRMQGSNPISFVSKLSADGSTLLWSTLLPTQGLTDVGVDSNGNVFALVTPLAQGVVTTPNAIASTGAYRWLGELDPGGAHLVYATYVPGLVATGIPGGMVVRQDGTVWIAGTAPGGSDLLDYPQCSSGPPTPVAVIGIDPGASKILTNFSFAIGQQNYGTGLQFDSNGNMYLSGVTCSTDYLYYDNTTDRCTNENCVVGFLAKLAAGTQTSLWEVTTNEWPVQAATDAKGNTALLKSQYPLYSHGQDPLPVVVRYFDSSGNQLWSSDAGPTGPALSVDAQGRIYVASTVSPVADGWASGLVEYGTKYGLMRIVPRAGSILVLPQTITMLNAATATANIFATGGTALPQPFTFSTTTPWLRASLTSTSGVPSASTGTMAPLPNWWGSRGAYIFPSTSMTLYTDGSLQPGTYDGTFTVTAPGMDNSPLTVPVHAVVGPGGDAIPPWIVISGDGIHSLLNFGAGITISSATPWIVPRPDGSDALIDESLLSAGMNTGYVTITTSGVGARSYQVTVYVIEGSYAGAMPQDLAAGPSNLSFLAEAGDTPKHATVAVWPANPVRQSFTARVEAQWLAASPSAGSAPSTVALTADPSGLQPGTYTTHLDIVSDQAANGTVRIPVTLTVQSQVPFNVDPAGVGVWNVAGAVPPTVQFDLTGDQPMTYQANASELFVYGIPPGSTPGQLSIALGPCSACAGDLELTTSGNDVRRVPVVEWSYPDVLFPLINAGGIVNDATFSQGPVAPGSIIAVFGTQLASSEYVAAPGSLRYDTPPDGPGFFPSDDDPFGVFYRSPNQWNLQVPTTLAPGTYRLWIGTSGTSAPAVFTVAPIAPYVFTWGANRGAVLNQDGSLNTPNHQAPAGSAIEVYLTGQGAVSPPVPTRQAAPASPLSYVSATTTATIDGVSASVPFAGLAPGFVGLCQVNVDIPGGLSPGQHKLVIDIAGVKTNEVNFDSN